jgi:hypothetical protein
VDSAAASRARLVEPRAGRRHVAGRDDAEELPRRTRSPERDRDAGDAAGHQRADVRRAARLELHLGGDGDAARQRAPLGGSDTDARTLERLRREMHLVLMLAFAMAGLFGVTLVSVPRASSA